MGYKKISDYGIIGNLHSVALVGLDGSIDWLCLPHIDSPAIFNALLDSERGGRFSVTPEGDWDSTAEYISDTNILRTRFRTRTGVFSVTDFMPVPATGEEELEAERHELYRLIEATGGEATVVVVFEPRFDYARVVPSFKMDGGAIIASNGGERVTLCSSHGFELQDGRAVAQWNLREGDRVWLYMNYGEKVPEKLDIEMAERALEETSDYWKGWLGRSETGRTVDLGPYREKVNRSALALKLLYYDPEGTIAAAATTSLPEAIGGTRNWDYRYMWLRDASFTLNALFSLGHLSEMSGYMGFITRLITGDGAERLRIMYGLRGETDLKEQELLHLDGYKGSRPVRVGNAASFQFQLDIYGEVMDAALRLSNYIGKIDVEMWPALRAVCDFVSENWRRPDFGLWEMRGGPFHFVYSKVMCWVALDRGLGIARAYGFPADLERWNRVRDEIKEEVLRKGWNEKKGAFVQHYETDALDASSLLIPLLGFLKPDDPRVASNLETIIKELSIEGCFLYRYRTDDFLPGREGLFLLCTFWLIDNLILLSRTEEAERLLNRIEGLSNHLGLFSEEYGFEWREALGNFPQAFTHIGFINSVAALCKAKGMIKRPAEETRKLPYRARLFGRIVLNEGEGGEKVPSKEVAERLKTHMNLLRGAFYDPATRRVAYERMSGSELYKKYVELSYSLRDMDLNVLKTREERIAFWINLYNVIVMHGVIELGVRDSVKEVRSFFTRVQYIIGGMAFSPDDIEHGILRGNRRSPNSLFRPFGEGDRRLRYSIVPMEPRIHFALVCASSSCPPIEVYTPESLDSELDISGRTFLNSGAVVIDKKKGAVWLSRIFKWYGEDFAPDQAALLRFIAHFLYRDEDMEYLNKNAERLEVDFLDYDWRLNKR